MTKPKKSKRSRPGVAERNALACNFSAYESVLRGFCESLLVKGVTPTDLAKMTQRVIASLATAPPDSDGTIHIALGKILFAWHRHELYVDRVGRPRPLSLAEDAAPSLFELAKTHSSYATPKELIDALISQRLIRPVGGGLYAPTAAVAQLRSLGPEVAEHLSESIARLLDTFGSNLSSRGPNPPLLERAAIVRDLPAGLAQEFRAFSAEQGESLAETVNEWLEARRARGGSAYRGRLVTAGVQVFAFVGSSKKRSPPHPAKRAAKSSRRSS